MKLQYRTLLTVVGIISIFPICIGLTGFIISTSAKTLIWVGKKLQPIEHQLESVQKYCLISVASGTVLFWSGGTLIQYLFEREPIEDSDTPSPDLHHSLTSSAEGLTTPTSCKNCKNYHGQSYGGHIFICAMHPYGCADESCSDYTG